MRLKKNSFSVKISLRARFPSNCLSKSYQLIEIFVIKLFIISNLHLKSFMWVRWINAVSWLKVNYSFKSHSVIRLFQQTWLQQRVMVADWLWIGAKKRHSNKVVNVMKSLVHAMWRWWQCAFSSCCVSWLWRPVILSTPAPLNLFQ